MSSLLDMIREKALQRGNFTLKSGKTSNYYLDMRKVLYDPEGLSMIAHKIEWDGILLKWKRHQAVTVVPFGALPLLGRLMVGHGLRGFVIRPEEKSHGTGGRIVGDLREGDKVLLAEDVITTGGSVIEAIAVIRQYKADVSRVVCVVDREEGGKKAIEDVGVPVHSLFTKTQILES